MSLAYWLNSAWMLKCGRQRNAFRRAMRNVEVEQAEVLRSTLSANRDTQFGRRCGFDSIHTPREFQERVPLSVYEDYREPIARMGAGQSNVLTAESVRLFEPTSGSSGPEKLVPYTAGLRRQFQRGLAVWIGDLLKNRPGAKTRSSVLVDFAVIWARAADAGRHRHRLRGGCGVSGRMGAVGFAPAARFPTWNRSNRGSGKFPLFHAALFARDARPHIDLGLESDISDAPCRGITGLERTIVSRYWPRHDNLATPIVWERTMRLTPEGR